METQNSPSGQSSLMKKEKGAGGIRLRDFALYYKATVSKTASDWHQNGNIDQCNRIESPEIKPHAYAQLISDKGGTDTQWRRDCLLNTWCWGNWTETCKTIRLEHSQTPYTKINTNWNRDPNLSLDTLKLVEENLGRTSLDINPRRSFVILLLESWK